MSEIGVLSIDRGGFLAERDIIFASSLEEPDMSLKKKENKQNREEFLAHFNIAEDEVAYMDVAYGNTPLMVQVKGRYTCDGLFTKLPIPLALATADCFPVLIFDERKRRIALLHCGWKGAVEELPLRLLYHAWDLGFRDAMLANIHVFFGPGICGDHYMVTDPIQLKFGKDSLALWMKFMRLKDSKVNLWKVDLAGYMKFRLVEYGVREGNILYSPLLCTWEWSSLPSYQRGDRERRFLTVTMIKT